MSDRVELTQSEFHYCVDPAEQSDWVVEVEVSGKKDIATFVLPSPRCQELFAHSSYTNLGPYTCAQAEKFLASLEEFPLEGRFKKEKCGRVFLFLRRRWNRLLRVIPKFKG